MVVTWLNWIILHSILFSGYTTREYLESWWLERKPAIGESKG